MEHTLATASRRGVPDKPNAEVERIVEWIRVRGPVRFHPNPIIDFAGTEVDGDSHLRNPARAVRGLIVTDLQVDLRRVEVFGRPGWHNRRFRQGSLRAVTATPAGFAQATDAK